MAAGELHDALSGAYAAIDPEEYPELSARLAKLLDCTGEDACAAYQASMDEAREEGRREERRACYAIAAWHADPISGFSALEIGVAENMRLGARVVADAIAARGPMEE